MLRLLLFLQNEYKANVRSKAFIGIFQCSQSYSSLLYNEENYLNVTSIIYIIIIFQHYWNSLPPRVTPKNNCSLKIRWK